MYNEDDSKWDFDAPHFWDLTGQTQQERPNDSWFNEKNISGPSFPPRKKRRPLRTHTYVAPTTEALPAKPPPNPRAVQEQSGSSSVFDRLAKNSTISFSKKMHPTSEQQHQPKLEKAKKQPKKQQDPQHQLEESSFKETVSERIARLEKACLDQGKVNMFKKKDIKLKKSIDLATALRRPVSSDTSSSSSSSSEQQQSVYHGLNTINDQVEQAGTLVKNVSQSPQHDEPSTQRRSLLDELKAFQQRQQQQQHSSSPRLKSMDREPFPTNQPLSVDREPFPINQPLPSTSIHSDHDSLTEQAQTLQEKDHQDHSLEMTRSFFNSFLVDENKEKEQKDKSIEITQNFFHSFLNKEPEITNLDTHQQTPMIDNTPQRKFTDFSDTYQRIKQLREQIRQVSQPRSRNEFTERKRTREYEGAHFIDERIKRARKVLKASKEKRRKWLSKK